MAEPCDGAGAVIVDGDGKPVAYDLVGQEVESHGWEDATLDLAPGSLNGGAVVALLARDYALRGPEVFKEMKEVGAHTIFLEGLEEAWSVNCVVRLAKVKVHLE